MSDLQGPVTMPEPGQAAAAPEAGITASAPAGTAGQAVAPQPDAGQTATTAPVEDTFFDPSTLPAELEPAYKSMQAAFTKKMQALSGSRQKIEAYDQFMADPVTNLQRMAQQYGLSLTRAQAQEAINQQQGQEDWQPQTWNDVMTRAKKEVMQEVMQQFQPLMQTVQKVQASNIESQLSKLDPNWRTYEDEMRANLQAHPSLVSDVPKLYRLSVPEEVYMSRATQAALKKLQDKAKGAEVSDKGTTSRSAAPPRKAASFAEAVEIAKVQLAEQGR